MIRGGYGIYSGLLRWAALQTGGPFAVTDSFLNPAVPATGGIPIVFLAQSISFRIPRGGCCYGE